MSPIALVLIVIIIVVSAFNILAIYNAGRAREKYRQMVLKKCQKNKKYREAWDVLRKSGKKSIEDFSEEERKSLAIVFQELADDERLLKVFNKMLNEPEVNFDEIEDDSLKM